MIEPRLLKGFRDYGPEEQAARQNMFTKIQAVFERFGFLPLSTPVLEYKDILLGKIGEEEKLIYSFKDNGERDVAMRYDLTVPLARYVAQNQKQITIPFKRYQIAPVWRAENTQKGRLREFYQCDIDIVGVASPIADAEVIACIGQALEALGITGYTVRLNDRSVFKDFSQDVVRSIDKLDKIGMAGVEKELSGKNISPADIAKVKSFIEDDSKAPEAVQQLIEMITSLGIALSKLKFDRTAARGLDYYTGTVFEIVLNDKPEFGSIVGGGRYDSLVDQFSETSLPAVGGSIGIDRLFEALQEHNLVETAGVIKVLVLNLEESLQADYLALITTLRQADISSELYYEPVKLDKQFKYAESKGIEYAIIMGADEKSKDMVQLKNLKTREQKEVSLGEIIKSLG